MHWGGRLADPAAALAILLGAGDGGPQRDQRIEAVLAAFQTEEGPLNAHGLVAALGLSRSRVGHIFRDDVGIPLRSFLLWSKLRRAFAGVAQGLSLTQAAHRAGFADSAHFSRTCLRMFGANPFAITGAVQFDQS